MEESKKAPFSPSPFHDEAQNTSSTLASGTGDPLRLRLQGPRQTHTKRSRMRRRRRGAKSDFFFRFARAQFRPVTTSAPIRYVLKIFMHEKLLWGHLL